MIGHERNRISMGLEIQRTPRINVLHFLFILSFAQRFLAQDTVSLTATPKNAQGWEHRRIRGVS